MPLEGVPREMTPYGIVASGQFPDFEVLTELYPAYHAMIGQRATLWSCNWEPENNLPKTEAATYAYGLPPSLGMCYHTTQYPNIGISGMVAKDEATILRLFRRFEKHSDNISTVYI